jgi:hypothetical protein
MAFIIDVLCVGAMFGAVALSAGYMILVDRQR